MHGERNDRRGDDNDHPSLRPVAGPPPADGEPWCQMCGAERLIDKEGFCSYCRRRVAEVDIHEIRAKLRMVEAAIKCAPDNTECIPVHPLDVRECVDKVLAGAGAHSQPQTLEELWAGLYHGLEAKGTS
jgi:hypothetical protein